MGYFFVLSLNLFDREIDFDRVLKLNNYCLAIKILDDIVDNDLTYRPMELLDIVCQDIEKQSLDLSELESHAFDITKMVMRDIGYSNNPGLQRATFELKESAKKSLEATNLKEHLKAEYEVGYSAGEVAAYALIPDIDPESNFMIYMRNTGVAGTLIDNIKNLRNDKKNFDLNGNLVSYLFSSTLLASRNGVSGLIHVPSGKKLEFIKLLMHYIKPLMSNFRGRN